MHELLTLRGHVADQMKARGLGPHQLAKLAGVEYQTISRWLTGRGMPNIRSMSAVCEALGITVSVHVPETAATTEPSNGTS